MNILIVNPFGIGDCLFSTPLIHTLKDTFPEGKLGFLCNKRTAPLLQNNPYIDELFIYERDDFKEFLSISWFKWLKEFTTFIKQLRKNRFDLAIDLSLAANFGFFLLLTGIKERIGYNYKNRGIYLTRSIKLTGYENKHVVEYYNDLLKLIKIEPGVTAQSLGVQPNNLSLRGVKRRSNPDETEQLEPKYRDLELYLKDEDKQYAEKIFREHRIDKTAPIIAIAPGGGASWGVQARIKHWPEEKFTLLIDKIIEKYKVTVIILGDLKERDLFTQLREQIQNKAISLVGETSLTQSAAVIYKSDIFIGNDGGPLHIAAALGKKTISFFGPVDPKVYGPYPPDEMRHIVLRKNLECSPCYRKFRLNLCQRNKECLERINVDEVIEKIDRLLLINQGGK